VAVALKLYWQRLSPYIFALTISYLFLAMAVAMAMNIMSIHTDSYLALVSGREISDTGITYQDNLSNDTVGRTWINSQWLSHLVFYQVANIGGIFGLIIFHILLLLLTGVLTGYLALKKTGSYLPVLIITPLVLVASFDNTFVRGQTLVMPLFVLSIYLISKPTSKSSFWLIPIMVLWANLHPSLIVISLLLGLKLITDLFDAPKIRIFSTNIILLGASIGALFCTPYKTKILELYQETIFNNRFRQLIPEWNSPGMENINFYFFLIVALVLITRARGHANLFTILALGALSLLALDAARNIIWFLLALALLLPSVIGQDPSFKYFKNWYQQLASKDGMAQTSLIVCALVSIYLIILPFNAKPKIDNALNQSLPKSAIKELKSLPNDSKVFASLGYSDRLLWEIPELQGRVSFDVRTELLNDQQLKDATNIRTSQDAQNRLMNDYDVFVMPNTNQFKTILQKQNADCVLYENSSLAIQKRC
jgi:hypothetical protein